jgi:sporulation protein YlmC with PRC-barrel domain
LLQGQSGAVRGLQRRGRGLGASYLVVSSIEMRAIAKHPLTGGMTTAAPRRERAMRLSDKTLHGRTVISADGKAIGSLTELFVSSADWRIESIRIELRKDVADRIGANRTLFRNGTIELPVSFIQSVGDAVVLALDVDALREAHRAPATDGAPQPTS